MQVPGLRVPAYETLEVLQELSDGCLAAARSPQAEPALLFIARSAETAAREIERLGELSGPGVPAALAAEGDAVVLLGAENARPLPACADLPDTVWRAALRRLLSGLAHVHGRGWTHGRISPAHIAFDPSGVAWLLGWAAAKPTAGRGPFQSGTDDVSGDLRDLGHAIVRHLAAVQAGTEVDPGAVERAASRLAAHDRELGRVVARLAAPDPREAYETATEALTDLGEPDESLPDPWFGLRFVARRRIVRNVLAHAERAGTRTAILGSYEITGLPGSGRSRILAEVATEARRRSMTVLIASGGATIQPWGGIGSLARQMLSRLPAGHPLRTDPGVDALVGERQAPPPSGGDSLRSDGAAAALASLLDAVFAGTRGVVLLDDEDALPSHARQVWATLGRVFAASAGTSCATAALLVSTAARASEPELTIPRERVELAELTRRQLVPLLGELLVERGKAAILGDALLEAAGGRPGEIVDHLRDMVARGALRPSGARYLIDDPAGAVRGSAAADRFRRATESAGREGLALAEALAAAGGLRFPRETVAELADLPAHRLSPAAESALRAGLLRRDGAGWTVRTESVRARLLRGLGDDRRRGVHREILQRLLDDPSPDWPQIAVHARASGDPRAAEWTRTAFRVLRAAGRFAEAAAHLDDALVLLEPGSIEPELRLDHADVLLNAGRLSDAIRAAEALQSDPAATPLQCGHAQLALARLHRYDQAWTRVLAVVPPADCGDPLVPAKIRCLHAVAHHFRGRADLADRELRLAAAEAAPALAADPRLAEELEYARLEVEAVRATLSWDAPAARAISLKRLRAQCSRRQPLQRVLDRIRIANSHRLAGDNRRARGCSRRTAARANATLGRNPLAASWLSALLALADYARGDLERNLRNAERAAMYAQAAGGTVISVMRRVEVARARARNGRLLHADYEHARLLATGAEVLSADEVLACARSIATVYLYCGLHAALEVHWTRVSSCDALPHVKSGVTSEFLCSSLLLDAIPTQIDAGLDETSERFAAAAQQLDELCLAGFVRESPPSDGWPYLSNAAVALLAHTLRTHGVQRCAVSGMVTLREWIAVALREASDSWMWTDVCCSLAIVGDGCLDSDTRGAIDHVVEQAESAVPTAMEWRRTLARAVVQWRRLRVHSAVRLATHARHQAEFLDRRESGVLGASAVRAARRLFDALRIPIPGQQRSSIRLECALPTGSPAHTSGAEPLGAWAQASAAARNAKRVFVEAQSMRELELFFELLHREPPSQHARVDSARPQPLSEDVIAYPVDQMEFFEARAIAARCRSSSSTGRRIWVGATQARQRVREMGGPWATIVECSEGVAVSLSKLGAVASERGPLFVWLLRRRFGPEAWTREEVLREVELYDWPGGIAEFEGVVTSCALGRGNELTLAALDACGWVLRRQEALFAAGDVTRRRVRESLAAGKPMSASECAQSVGVPLRSTQRILADLVAAGAIRKSGCGRATRYTPM